MSIRRRSVLALLSVASIAAALAIGVGTARAGNVVVVHTGHCVAVLNGNATVPAGSTVDMFGGVYDAYKGVVINYLHDHTTLATLNGGPPVNINSLYTAPSTAQPFGGAPPGTWLSYFIYPTGITLANPGDSLTFTYTDTLNRLFAEPFNGPVPFALGYPPGTVFFTPGGTTNSATCTVTAV
jgi:hypothetical protein